MTGRHVVEIGGDGRLRHRYGRWAVVTGASDGIGRACAEQLAHAGLDLVLVARRAPALGELAAQLAERHGVACRALALDLAEPAAVEQLLAGTAGLEVGLLIAAAGYGTSGPLIDSDPLVEAGMIDVNCRVPLMLARHFGRRFVAQRRGGIVLFSSLLAFQGVPRAANYAATKAYVQTLAEGLHRELAPHGVDVVASAPGPVHSGFAARANLRMGVALEPRAVARATLKALGRRVTVRPGWLSWGLEASLAPLPRALRVRILALVMAGMTAHHAG